MTEKKNAEYSTETEPKQADARAEREISLDKDVVYRFKDPKQD